MQNECSWRPTKFVQKADGKWRGTRDREQLFVGSRLFADIIAEVYGAHLPLFARGQLVDLGCGAAPFYGMYRPHVDQVTCADWQVPARGANHLDLLADMNFDLPFSDDSFDTVILSDVLEHLPDPARAWRELGRILRPGGHLLLNVPFYYWIHEAPHDYLRFTEFALRRFATEAGIEPVIVEPLGGAPEILTDIWAKLVAGVPVIGSGLARFCQTVTRVFLTTSLGRQVSMKTARRFPLGYFVVGRRCELL